MIQFFKNIVYFVMILIIINTCLFFIVKKDYLDEYNFVNTNYNNYMLSDSHGEHLKDYINKIGIENFSKSSDSYVDMERKLKFLISVRDLDTLYLAFDEHLFSNYRDISNNWDRSIYFETISFELSYFIDRYIKYYMVFINPKYRDVIKLFNKNEINSKEITNIESFDKNIIINQAKKRYNSLFVDKSISQINLDAFYRIIEICNENNITLIFIKFPLANIYNNLIKEDHFKITQMIENHEIKIIDLKNVFNNDQSLFIDVDHLNDNGAKKIPEILKQKVNEI